MELLSVAQKYEMNSVLIRIRDRVARQDPSFVHPENALYVFSLFRNTNSAMRRCEQRGSR
jgi:hypothetical protein